MMSTMRNAFFNTNFGDKHDNKMTGWVDHRRVDRRTSCFNKPPKSPTIYPGTPPAGDSNEVDDAGSIDYRLGEVRRRLRSFESWPSPYVPRSPTPPQGDSNEVDDAGSMDYRFEEVRLRSFEGWPSPYVRPADLAAAGFFYTKHIDRVRCFECGTEVCRWEDGDDPMSEHQRWGGRCRFIRKQPCGNVPIGADPSTIPMPRVQGRDVCGPYRLDYRLNAEADTHTASTSTSEQYQQQHLPEVASLGALGFTVAKKPDYPEKASYEARLQSFKNWPTSMAQKKEDMAEAGFFYTGYGDETNCYQCGGGLKNWEPQDDPWTQHAKWFSTCYYVRLVKGQEFINTVTGKYVPPLSEEETKNLNLPNFIQKMESSIQQKPECREQSTSQEVQTEEPEQSEQIQQQESENITEQSAPLEIPYPKPRTSIQKNSIPNSTSISTNPTPSARSGSQQPAEKKPTDDRVCKICCDEELSVVFLPCRHLVACVKCAPGMSTCAVCRQPVTMSFRLFWS